MSSSSTDIHTRMLEREDVRRQAAEKRKAEKLEERGKEGTAAYFTAQLEEKKVLIVESLNKASSVDKTDLPTYFDDIFAKFADVQKLISNSSIFLSSYDIKAAQKQMLDLTQLANSKKSELLPQKKFAFLSRKKEGPSSNMPDGAAKSHVEAKSQPVKKKVLEDTSKVFGNKTDENLELRQEDVVGQDVNLTHLTGCEVRLLGPASTLHITHCSQSTILCGPVSSSIFVEDCPSCVFVLACQQLRVHSSTSSSFYIHVTSRAVIEDCQQLTFAPYQWSYPDLDADYKVSGLDRDTNNWDLIHDFNWLASQEHSPNWRILPEDQRITFSS